MDYRGKKRVWRSLGTWNVLFIFNLTNLIAYSKSGLSWSLATFLTLCQFSRINFKMKKCSWNVLIWELVCLFFLKRKRNFLPNTLFEQNNCELSHIVFLSFLSSLNELAPKLNLWFPTRWAKAFLSILYELIKLLRVSGRAMASKLM